MDYTTPYRVLNKAGVTKTSVNAVSDLHNVSNTYYTPERNVLEEGLVKIDADGIATEVEPTNVGLNSFTFPAALQSTDQLEYHWSEFRSIDVEAVICDAEGYITTKLTGFDATKTPTLERIATWLAAGYLMTRDYGYVTPDNDFKLAGEAIIKKGEEWLKYELKRQMMDNTYRIGEVIVVSDED